MGLQANTSTSNFVWYWGTTLVLGMLDKHQLSCFVFGLKIYNMEEDKSNRIFEKHNPHLGIQAMYHYVKEIGISLALVNTTN